MMKLKEGFVLRSVGTENVVIPTGGDLNLNMMITLNETGRFLWERLSDGANCEELVEALLAEYDVDEATARNSVEKFVRRLEENGFLE